MHNTLTLFYIFKQEGTKMYMYIYVYIRIQNELDTHGSCSVYLPPSHKYLWLSHKPWHCGRQELKKENITISS